MHVHLTNHRLTEPLWKHKPTMPPLVLVSLFNVCSIVWSTELENQWEILWTQKPTDEMYTWASVCVFSDFAFEANVPTYIGKSFDGHMPNKMVTIFSTCQIKIPITFPCCSCKQQYKFHHFFVRIQEFGKFCIWSKYPGMYNVSTNTQIEINKRNAY